MQPMSTGSSSATPERIPNFLLSSSGAGVSGSPNGVQGGSSGIVQASPFGNTPLRGGDVTPQASVTFNERLRPGGGGTPSPVVVGGSGAAASTKSSTPARMPPSRSILDAGPPSVLAVKSPGGASTPRTPFSTTATVATTPLPGTPGLRSAPNMERWITIFGFPPSLESSVLREFRRHGDVVRTMAGRGNWIHLMYATPVQAQVALYKPWRIVGGGSTMIGIVPCTEPEIAKDMEEQVERGILVASPSAPPTPNSSTPMIASPSPMHRNLRTPSSILKRDVTPNASGTPSAIRTPQRQKGFFGYLADLYG